MYYSLLVNTLTNINKWDLVVKCYPKKSNVTQTLLLLSLRNIYGVFLFLRFN